MCFEGKTQIKINDDFDLRKIAISGQCFRVKDMGHGTFRFITGNHLLYIRPLGNSMFSVSCHKDTWDSVWHSYFDLDCDYRSIRLEEEHKHSYVSQAMKFGRGLRVLRQDAWEMLVTFIISQRKNIPAIAKAVEMLATRYGQPMNSAYETVFTFPTAQELSNASVEEIKKCGLGYRAPYVHDAIQKISRHLIDMNDLTEYDDDRLFRTLMQIYGVGKKVANCVCLFGYGRTSRVPTDVWINRVIQREFQGVDFQAAYGDRAGIIQQYLFFYERSRWQK